MYSSDLICKILVYLNENINKEITIDELSSIFYYDKTYIMKKFKCEIGITIHDYINSIRIYNSLESYKEDNYVLGIAFKNGFQSIEYYSETFKKYIGVSPRTYKYYIFYNPNLSLNDEYTIRSNIMKLIILRDKVSKYLINKKPTGVLVKKISL